MKRILLIRHAKAEKNITSTYGGSGSPILKSEVEKIREFVVGINNFNVKYDIIFYSPRLQCEETAKNISNFLNIKYTVYDNLIPIKMGVIDGLNDNEIMNQYPNLVNELNAWKIGDIEINQLKIPQMENCFEFYEKGVRVIEDLTARNKNIIIVATRSNLILLTNILLHRNPQIGGGYKEITWPNCNYLAFDIDGINYNFVEKGSSFNPK